MPYTNLPKSKWETMDKCVKDVMAQGKSKDSAIAICHSSIVGDKKKADLPVININFYGEYWNEVVKKETEEEPIDDSTEEKIEELREGVTQKNMAKKDNTKEMQACMDTKMKD